MASGAEEQWWSRDTLAVVTGGNKGIGYEVVKQLAEHGVSVILTARNAALGSAAAEALSSAGLNVTFRALDVGNEESIRQFVDWLRQEHGGLDILVNNAGTYSPKDSLQNVNTVLHVNYWGPVLLTRELLPLFKSSPAGARVVNVTSAFARLEYVKDEAWRQKMSDSNLDQKTLDNFISVYLDAVRAADPEGPQGWSTSYHTSKLALNAFTRILAKDSALHTAGRTVYINSVHPGYVKTDMLALLPAWIPAGTPAGTDSCWHYFSCPGC